MVLPVPPRTTQPNNLMMNLIWLADDDDVRLLQIFIILLLEQY